MWAQRFAAIVVTSSVTFTLCNLFIIKEGLGSVLILTRPTRVSTSAQLGNLLSADGWFVLCYDALIAMESRLRLVVLDAFMVQYNNRCMSRSADGKWYIMESS